MQTLLNQCQRVPHEMPGMPLSSCVDDLHGENVPAALHGRTCSALPGGLGSTEAGSNEGSPTTAVNQKGEIN
jgi:hypothetical protein